MDWKLFLDDEREVSWVFPSAKEGEFKVARDHYGVRQLISEMGCMPSYIAFDHDLGVDFFLGGIKPTGYDVALELVARDQKGDITFPDNFAFSVHSSNPAGAENIRCLLNNYLKFKRENPNMDDFDLMDYRMKQR